MIWWNKVDRDKLLKKSIGKTWKDQVWWVKDIVLGRCGTDTEEQKKLFKNIEDVETNIKTLEEKLKELRTKMKEICSHPVDYAVYESRLIEDTIGKTRGSTLEFKCLRCGEIIYFREEPRWY